MISEVQAMQVTFNYIVHLKTTGVDPKCLPDEADGLASASLQVYKIKE